MGKKLFFIATLLVSAAPFAQTVQRIAVSGLVQASAGEDVDGVSVYNISTGKGTVTDSLGRFTVQVAANDRLHISAIHFKPFVAVVGESVIGDKQVTVFLSPYVNYLEEVILKSHDLTGNLAKDAKTIDANVLVPNWDLSYAALEFKNNFKKDALSTIEGNAAEEALGYRQVKNGANIVGVVALLVNAVLPQGAKKESGPGRSSFTAKVQLLKNRFSPQYLNSVFGVPDNLATDFLFYAVENGFTESMLKGANGLQLTNFMFAQSQGYKNSIGEK
ncbi:MAG: hypothetical protein ACPG7E_05245 [Marinirhabdus sp.]